MDVWWSNEETEVALIQLHSQQALNAQLLAINGSWLTAALQSQARIYNYGGSLLSFYCDQVDSTSYILCDELTLLRSGHLPQVW